MLHKNKTYIEELTKKVISPNINPRLKSSTGEQKHLNSSEIILIKMEDE